MTAFRLAHLSDPHLPPPSGALRWRDVVSKRLLSRLAWRRKGEGHDPALLGALVADVRAYAPDHTAITGDLTNFATEAEFAAARIWLEGLGAAGNITVSPGNHDALVEKRDDPFGAWRPWLGDDSQGAFPHLRRRGGVVLINVCSARPTAPHLATGRLGAGQLGRLDTILRDVAGGDLARVLLIHHPPAPGAVAPRKALEDGAALREVLAVHGVDLVLHGHVHEATVSRLRGPDGDIPTLGVPSASATAGGHHPAARWHAIEIARTDGRTVVDVHARGLVDGKFEALGAYRLVSPQRA